MDETDAYIFVHLCNTSFTYTHVDQNVYEHIRIYDCVHLSVCKEIKPVHPKGNQP